MNARARLLASTILCAALSLAACLAFTSIASAAPAGGVDLSHLQLTVSQLATGFSKPDVIVNAGDGSGRVFVAEQTGLIRVLRNGVVQPQPYLDLTSSISLGPTEYGLDGLVFAPTFATTGRLYVYYTAPGDYDVLERLTVSDPATDTPTIVKRTVLIRQKKFTTWHHGGALAFDKKGYLFVGVGDGGPMGDPSNHAQNPKLILGKILRIDPGDHVGQTPFAGTYTIPKSNPFYTRKGYRKEIWAVGLRNPFRFSFDRATGNFWIGDVGQDSYEEIDLQLYTSKGGQNYGWHYWEGNHRYRRTPTTKLKPIARKGYTFPIVEIPHPSSECVIGGYVYRGTKYPALYGTYLYADWVYGWIAGVRRNTPAGAILKTPQKARLMTVSGAWISSWGEDESGELYFADWQNGAIYSVGATTR